MEPATPGQRLTSCLAAVLLGLGGAVPPAGAQPTADGAALTLALRNNVVAIEATWKDGTVHDGFGFITAARGGETYIVTADHVLRGDDPGQIAESVELRLRQMPGRSYQGEVLETHEPGIDLAVLSARLPSELDWRRDALAPRPAELTFGTPVWFIGRDREWYVPANPGAVNQVSGLRHEIMVDDLGVRVGSSGAPLVGADGIVGMVVRDAAADTASATLITAVELAFREWGLPWELTTVGPQPEQEPTAVQQPMPQPSPEPTAVDRAAVEPNPSEPTLIEPSESERVLGLTRARRQEVQLALNQQGYDAGLADGLFGPRTRAAIRSWQEAAGLRITGYLDKQQVVRLLPAVRQQQLNEASMEAELATKTWERTFGGAEGDYFRGIAGTSDGAALVVGRTSSIPAGVADGWLIKVDQNGQELWSRTFGDARSDQFEAISLAADDGILLVGATGSGGANYDPHHGWLLKVDQNGEELWSRTFDQSTEDDFLNAIAATGDGGFLLAGEARSSGWLVRVDQDGRELWRRTLGGHSGWDELNAIVPAGDGSFVMAGSVWYAEGGAGSQDGFLQEIDRTGRDLWHRTFGGTEDDTLRDVVATIDGGFVAVGETEIEGPVTPTNRSMLLRIDQDGDELWRRTFSFGEVEDSLNAMAVADDGGFLLVGWAVKSGYDADGLLVKVDRDGRELWRRTFGGIKEDRLYAIAPMADGGFALAGYGYNSDGWLLKVDRDGRLSSELTAER